MCDRIQRKKFLMTIFLTALSTISTKKLSWTMMPRLSCKTILLLALVIRNPFMPALKVLMTTSMMLRKVYMLLMFAHTM